MASARVQEDRVTGIWTLFRDRRAQKRRAEALYRNLMAAALAPEAYAAGAVPDDLDHRVQMVSLHAALLTWRLSRCPEKELRQLPRQIHACIFDGFDASFRETGVGDASIARKVRKLGEHHYGLGTAIAQVLSAMSSDRAAGLAEVLQRNGVTAPGREMALAGHLLVLADAFEASPSDVFLAGEAPWQPFPATSRRSVAKV